MIKKLLIALLIATGAVAAPFRIGETLDPLSLEDQFGKKHPMKTMPKTLVLAFEKSAGMMANEYLASQEPGYLARHNAALIADISQMPKFVADSFALPKIRKYAHPVLLIRDEELGLRFPAEEDKLTVFRFEGNTLVSIRYVTTTAELKEVLEH